MGGKILIIDDEPEAGENCRRLLSLKGYECISETDPFKALAKIEFEKPDLVLTDLMMAGMDGLQVMKQIKKTAPDVSVVLLTAYATVQTAVEAMREGAFDYLQKPFSSVELEAVVERALEHRTLLEQNRNLRSQLQAHFHFDEVVGNSEAIKEVFDLIHRIASSQANVLLYGETGTGKEMIARSIHANSERTKQPFIPIDCSALTETLLETELFGHEKGAFTGAHITKPGLFELANGGTVFLDEVSGMSMPLQTRLLRVIQERQVRRVGGTRFLDVDVRIISASNKDLEKEVRDGLFRTDLFYRLNVVLVSLPPLRLRNGDVSLLADHFLRRFSESNQKPVKELDSQTGDLLKAYHWPGNVRELQNVIERAVAVSDGPALLPEHLPDRLRYRTWISQGTSLEGPMKVAKQGIIESFERNYLVDLMKKNSGHIGHSALEAGVDRKTIERLLKKHALKAHEV